MKLETIVVATDFSESANHAVAVAADYAKHFEAQLVLVHAYRVDIPVASPLTGGGYILPEGFYEQLAKQANAQVEKAAKALEKEGVAAVGVAVDQQAATAIVEEARARKADLIVMGTRGLTGIKHLALGSVADRVVRTAPCPVLTVGGED
ncbi:MAG: universal stress protein [Spirochaetaceae bacterium]|nr:universal stress protein [Myxococcales bacterium]MCB9726222.1 universal stress protein [Spirochaetaceae bacterium]HPG24668.1 universal stress protein [Myxococcota bacterium]